MSKQNSYWRIILPSYVVARCKRTLILLRATHCCMYCLLYCVNYVPLTQIIIHNREVYSLLLYGILRFRNQMPSFWGEIATFIFSSKIPCRQKQYIPPTHTHTPETMAHISKNTFRFFYKSKIFRLRGMNLSFQTYCENKSLIFFLRYEVLCSSVER